MGFTEDPHVPRQAGIRLPERGQGYVWMNGLGLSKGAYSIMKRDGQVSESFRPMPPSVLLVERAALVEHMISELERLEPDRLFHCSTASVQYNFL